MRRRGMGWALVDEEARQVEKLDVRAVTVKTDTRVEVIGGLEGRRDAGRSDDRVHVSSPSSLAKKEEEEALLGHDDDADEPAISPGFEDKARSRQDTRFLIRFKTRMEAKRFRREWHGRWFPVRRDFRPDLAERHGVVSVEVLW
ncbi:hypothetical protein LTS18_008433 [Coniosporium uncinatum]|uniref:Uncharacterized protein n=1 Tax=Coniosporium uncinatum TaxID=93489 RepID=A0ACC3DA94_9PEZI|nr:hypothetical protein LTS18_008433 [Coniosporium uncinatum]